MRADQRRPELWVTHLSTNSAAASLGLVSIETCAVITLYGHTGASFLVDWSDTMGTVSWLNLTNVALSQSPFTIIDLNSTHVRQRFYRTQQTP